MSRVATAIAGLALAFAGGSAYGAAFALQENSGSGLGNAFAGGAASAEDASTIWTNPAGMSKLPRLEGAIAVHVITPSFKFHDDGSVNAAFQPLGGTGGDAGSSTFVPNVFVNVPINPAWNFGIGINAPFGLKTEYDDGWLGRFQGLKSDIKTIDVNPSVSWKVTPTFAVGAGVNWQRVDAEFTQNVNYSAALAQAAGVAAAGGLIPPALIPTIVAATPGLQAKTKIEADDSAWGWNLGFLWDVTPDTRVGGQWRSSIRYHATGNVTFDYPALPALPPALGAVVGGLAANINGGPLNNGGITTDIKLPDIANLSIFSRLNPQWDVMADVQWTRWSTIKDLTFVRTTGVTLASTPENFDDAWRVAVGATYHTGPWALRGGLAWDETPVNTTDRTVRLPDENRFWLTAGAQYKFNPNWKLDAGFAYIWINSGDINQNAGSTAANGLVKGHYDASVTIFSAQLTYTF
jgi:long-chain fatty acid transport protein